MFIAQRAAKAVQPNVNSGTIHFRLPARPYSATAWIANTT